MHATRGSERRKFALVQGFASFLLCLALSACGSAGQERRDRGVPEVGYRVMAETSVPIDLRSPIASISPPARKTAPAAFPVGEQDEALRAATAPASERDRAAPALCSR